MSARGRGRGRGAPAPSRGRGRGGSSTRGQSSTRGRSAPPKMRSVPEREETFEEEKPIIVDDTPVHFERISPQELQKLKSKLLNVVSASLIKEPRFTNGESTAVTIKQLVKRIAFYDPEFILKLALYTRDDLGIRSTSNFIVAVAADIPECQPFLKKYLKSIIRLPSDWLDIASTYQVLPDRYLQGNSLPTALRKAMVSKFSDFDVYQLGKYNKERSIKRKAKKNKGKEKDPNEKQALTIKGMIRQLHISEPPVEVMSLLGKKYPSSPEEFKASKLPGQFDGLKAGKRMKLPTPETWETLVSEKGNKASTWEELIEHNKLPFMAMLRNLRNLIFTGVNPKYHRWVMNKLKNEITVANSRQFPTRFFSAYDVIPKDLDDFKAKLQAQNSGTQATADGSKRRAKKKPITPAMMPKAELFDEYRAALDTAVKLATIHNVKPIRGGSVVFCNIAKSQQNCPTAKGMGGAISRLHEVGVLLGLMCKYACEDCDLLVFGSSGCKDETSNRLYRTVELAEGTILDNMKRVLSINENDTGDDVLKTFPFEYFEDLIRTRTKIDNFIIVGNLDSNNNSPVASVSNILAKYRQEVNPELLFVHIDLSGRGAILDGSFSAGKGESRHPNDIQISGYSDAILRFIAERGDTNQIQYIENIDIAKKLAKKKSDDKKINAKIFEQLDHLNSELGSSKNVDKTALLKARLLKTPASAWKTARIFVSSTFLDMHGERDMLARFVFPELRQRCYQQKIHLYEVDLRWGVTEEESQGNKSLEICLSEVDRCKPFFISILGSRYGWCPGDPEKILSNLVGTNPAFDWLKDYPKNKSITEMEISMFLNGEGRKRGLFFLRDDALLRQMIPDEHLNKFFDDSENIKKLEELKSTVRNLQYSQGDHKVVEYQGVWGGLKEGKPVTKNLEKFRDEALEFLWQSIQSEFPEHDPASKDEEEQVNNDEPENETIKLLQDSMLQHRHFHDSFLESRSVNFVGRKDLRDVIVRYLSGEHSKNLNSNTLVVLGKPGSGKSALIAKSVMDLMEKHPNVSVVYHFVGSGPSSNDVRFVLKRLCYEVIESCFEIMDASSKRQKMEAIPDDVKELTTFFAELVEEACYYSRVVIVFDAVDQLSNNHRAHSLEWLPSLAHLPVKILVSAMETHVTAEVLRKRFNVTVLGGNNSTTVTSIGTSFFGMDEGLETKQRDNAHELTVGALSNKDKAEIVRSTLALYNKKLDEKPMNDQMRVLLKKSDSDKPLYLILACHELRLFGVYEELSEKIASLPPTIPKLLDEVISRVEHDHGAELIRAFFSLFAASRAGLLEQELLSMLNKCLQNSKPTQETSSEDSENSVVVAVPTAVWRRLYWSLHDFLRAIGNASENQYDLFHKELTKAVKKKYFESNQEWEIFVHRQIAEFYLLESDPAGQGNFQMPGAGNAIFARAISELPYHLAKGKKWKVLEKLMCNLSFIEIKCRLGFTFELIEDYLSSLNEMNKPIVTTASCASSTILPADSKALRASEREKMNISNFKDFIMSQSHVLRRHPELTFQQAVNQPDGSTIARIAHNVGPNAALTKYYLQWANKVQSNDPCKQTIHMVKGITSVAVSPDGKKIACATKDSIVRLFRADTGQEIGTLMGHSNWIASCCFSFDSNQLLTGSWDQSVKVWVLNSDFGGEETLNLTGHTRVVNCVAFSPDTKYVLSASWDCTLRLWEAVSGTMKKTFRSHVKPINSASFSADGQRIVSGSWDGIMFIWDLEGNPISKMFVAPTVLAALEDPDDAPEVDNLAELWDQSSSNNNSKKPKPQRSFEVTITGGKSVKSCSFSPNGKQVVSCSVDRSLRLWDSSSGKEISELGSHNTGILSCHFDEEGERLISGSEDGNLKLWQAVLGTELAQDKTLIGAAVIHTMKFSADGLTLAGGANDGSLYLWDAQQLVQVARLTGGHTRTVNNLVWLPVPKGAKFIEQLATVSDDGTAVVWNITERRVDKVLKGHRESVHGVDVSPDGSKLVTASDDFSVKIWDLKDEEEIVSISGHGAVVRCCAFGPKTGRWVISGGRDNLIRMWNANTGAPIAVFKGHLDWINSVRFSSDERKIISASWDFNIKVWTVKTATEKCTLKGHSSCPSAIEFSSDNKKVISSSFDGTVRVWDALAGTEVSSVTIPEGRINCMAMASASGKVVVATDDGTVKLMDLFAGIEMGQLVGHSQAVNDTKFFPGQQSSLAVSVSDDKMLKIWDLKALAETSKSSQISAMSHSKMITCISSSVDGSRIATAGFDNLIKVWDAQTGRCLKTLRGHTSAIRAVVFSPDPQYLFSAGDDCVINYWDLVSGQVVRPFRGHTNSVSGLAVSPDGSGLASSSWDTTVNLWDTKTAKLRYSLKGHKDWVLSVAWAGNFVASGSCDHSVIVWNSNNGSVYTRFEGNHEGWITALAFSPDGKQLASGSTDGAVVVMNVTSQTQLFRMAHHDSVSSLAFAAKGKVIVSASRDHTMKVWNAKNGASLTSFVASSPCTAVTATPKQICLTDYMGKISLFNLKSTVTN